MLIVEQNKSNEHLFPTQAEEKESLADGKQEAVAVEKAEAEGSSDEDEGALVIDEKNERGGAKRKAGESTEVSFHRVF